MITDGTSSAERATLRSGSIEARRARFRLQYLFLERLDRLVNLKATCLECEYFQPIRLLDQALFSTYWDCVQLGLRPQAREVLGLSEVPVQPPS